MVSSAQRRYTPAGTPVRWFRLKVPATPGSPAAPGCEIPVVCLGPAAEKEIPAGARVLVIGSLAERRWYERAGAQKRRLEVLAASVRLL